MLATLVHQPFDRRGWLFEIKWDGYRAIAEVDKGQMRLYSRNGLFFTKRYWPITADLQKLEHQAVLDGEVAVLDEKGHPSFESLQNYRNHRATGPLVYQVFDILYLDGHDLRGLPLRQRKAILQQILPKVPDLSYCEHIEDTGLAFFDAVAKAGLEGMVAKDGNSVYWEGRRSDCWLKVKANLRQEAVIGGFTRPNGRRQHFGALVLGLYEDGELVHIGEVGGGFSASSLANVFAQRKPLVHGTLSISNESQDQGAGHVGPARAGLRGAFHGVDRRPSAASDFHRNACRRRIRRLTMTGYFLAAVDAQ
jgi:bifunctional non-homologous end joining protein LigD